MEFPESLEEHLRQVVKHIIDKTTAELQELFRHHWKAIPGNYFWDSETGNEFWRSCYTLLKPTSKQKIVKGQFSKWSIADLAVLLPELMQETGNISLALLYSEVLKNIQDLVKPFEKESFVALSGEEFNRFQSSLNALLVQLDIDTMTLSSITRDVISVEDLTRAVAEVMNIKLEKRPVKIISLVTEFLATFPNLTPYFKEALLKLRCRAQAGRLHDKIGTMTDCFKLLKLNGSYSLNHVNLTGFYFSDAGENLSLYFYHNRKRATIQSHRPQLFNFLKTFLDKRPQNMPASAKLNKGFILMRKDKPTINDYIEAMEHFKQAMLRGASLPIGGHAHCLTAIMLMDLEAELFPLNPKNEQGITYYFQKAVWVLTEAVTKESSTYKYNSDNSCRSEIEKNGQTNFVLGYLYEKGLLPRDFNKAKALYQTAVTKYNNEVASYYLGSMYYDGAGVRKSYMWAKFYWQHSVVDSEREEWAKSALIDYYLKHLEYSSGCFLELFEPKANFNVPVKCLLKRLQKFKKHRVANQLQALKHQLVACEKTWKLSGKGLTFLDRLKRVELLGFQHEFGAVIKEYYHFFKLSYGTERNSQGDCGTMSEYVHGLDESLEVDYSQLFSRIYLVAPGKVFTVTTFRLNMANNQQPKWKIKYNTRKRTELIANLPNTFNDNYPLEQFTVVEDLLFMEDAIYLLLEDRVTGAIQQLRLAMMKTVMRMEKHLKLEYGAKVTLSYLGQRIMVGNADEYFNDVLGPVLDVIVMGKEVDMCRFCFDPIVKAKECVCGFRYCGKACLEKDRKYLKHEYLCCASG